MVHPKLCPPQPSICCVLCRFRATPFHYEIGRQVVLTERISFQYSDQSSHSIDLVQAERSVASCNKHPEQIDGEGVAERLQIIHTTPSVLSDIPTLIIQGAVCW